MPVCDQSSGISQIPHEWTFERLLDQTYMIRLNSSQTAMQGNRIVEVFTERRSSCCTMLNRCLGERAWREYGGAARLGALPQFGEA